MTTPISIYQARRRLLASAGASMAVSTVVAPRVQDIRAYLEVCAPSPCLVVQTYQDGDGVSCTVVHSPAATLIAAPVATGTVPEVAVAEADAAAREIARRVVRAVGVATDAVVRAYLPRDISALERKAVAGYLVASFGAGAADTASPRHITLWHDHPIGSWIEAAGVWNALREARLALPRYIEVEADGYRAQITAPIAATEVSEAAADSGAQQSQRVLRIAGDYGVSITDVRRAVCALEDLREALQRLREDIMRRGGGGFDETGYIKAIDFGPDEPLNVVALSDYEEIRAEAMDLAAEVLPLAPRGEALAALYTDEGVAELSRTFSYITGKRALDELEAMARNTRRRAGMPTAVPVLEIRDRVVPAGGKAAAAAVSVLGYQGLGDTQVLRAAGASMTRGGHLNLGTLVRWGSWLSMRGASSEYPVWGMSDEDAGIDTEAGGQDQAAA